GLEPKSRDPQILQHLRDAAEKTKIALTDAVEAKLVVELPSKNIQYRHMLQRADLEAILKPFIDRTIDKCRAALRDAHLTGGDIDEVVLVGGSTRIPYVRQRVAEFFGRAPHT